MVDIDTEVSVGGDRNVAFCRFAKLIEKVDISVPKVSNADSHKNHMPSAEKSFASRRSSVCLHEIPMLCCIDLWVFLSEFFRDLCVFSNQKISDVKIFFGA